MNEHEPINNEHGAEVGESEGMIEAQNIRNEMAAIETDIEAGNPLTPELLGHFQELGAKIADQEPEVEAARFMLAFDSAVLKFKAGYLEAAIDDLRELADSAYAAGEQYDPIVEMADEKKAEYEAELAKQPKP